MQVLVLLLIAAVARGSDDGMCFEEKDCAGTAPADAAPSASAEAPGQADPATTTPPPPPIAPPADADGKLEQPRVDAAHAKEELPKVPSGPRDPCVPA